MPEGQVSHHNAIALGKALAGRTLTAVDVAHPRLVPQDFERRLAGDAFDRFAAAGKHHLVHFASGRVLHSHLRMSGSWRLCGPQGPRHRGGLFLVLMTAAGGACLYRCPQVRLLDAHEPLPGPVRALGPDLLAPEVDPGAVTRRAVANAPVGQEIGETLLDQRAAAGIGNAYKNEALFLAGISPWRAAADVDADAAQKLGTIAGRLLADGVRDGGMIRTYTPGGAGVPGAPSHWVHRRANRPCRRCGTAIRSRGHGDENRTSYWCPTCQR